IAHRARSLIAARASSHGHGSFRSLAVADHEHVRHLLELSLPNLISDLFLALVDLDAHPSRSQPIANRRGIGEVAIGYRENNGLDGRQPEWKCPGVVLDQNGDEPLEAAEDRPMD